MATGFAYTNLGNHLGAARIDWANHNIRVSLHTSAHVPSQDADVWVSDIDNELPSGGGYTIGGFPLANKAIVMDNATNEARYRADNVTITGASITFRYAIIADKQTGVSTTQPVIGLVNYLSNQAPAGTDYILAWPATGIVALAAAAES